METKTIEEIKTELGSLGAKYALTKRHRHPSVSSNMINKKGAKEIFDLNKTSEQIKEGISFLLKTISSEHKVLFVASRKELEIILKETAESINMPYVISRWIGGTLTNAAKIKTRIEHLQKLKKEKENSSWEDKYTKKECVLFDRELNKLEVRFGGLLSLTEVPRALFEIKQKKEYIAVNEANAMNIPVVSIGNSDTDILKIKYPIITNCNSIKTIKYILEMLKSNKKT